MSKERLVELIDQCTIDYDMPSSEQIADYLLANGVVVPPCKVRDVVYRVTSEWNSIKKRYESFISEEGIAHVNVSYLFITSQSNVFGEEYIGHKIFLSREEAEAKLRESKRNET